MQGEHEEARVPLKWTVLPYIRWLGGVWRRLRRRRAPDSYLSVLQSDRTCGVINHLKGRGDDSRYGICHVSVFKPFGNSLISGAAGDCVIAHEPLIHLLVAVTQASSRCWSSSPAVPAATGPDWNTPRPGEVKHMRNSRFSLASLHLIIAGRPSFWTCDELGWTGAQRQTLEDLLSG